MSTRDRGAGRRGRPRRSWRCSRARSSRRARPGPRPTAVGLTETSARPPPDIPAAASRAEQPHVLVGDRGGLLRVDGVLAQVVEGDQQAVVQQPPRHGQRVVGGVAGHEPGHDAARQRGGGDEADGPVRWPTRPAALGAARTDDLPDRRERRCPGQPRLLAGAHQRPRRGRRSVTVTFAPASGGTMTSCAAGRPVGRQRGVDRDRPLDQGERDRPELVVPRGRADEPDPGARPA